MQNLFKKAVLLTALVAWPAASAEEAVVTEGKINVRGQPSLIGEVVTQLQRGEKVTVLERIEVQNPKPGDPAAWARIKLPANTPVWVFSPFVKDGAVSATRLNLRAGPGENYSVLGRLEKGAPIKSIRTIEEWMEIEAPADSYAFVDASLVKSEGGTAAPVTAVAAAVTPAAAASTPAITPEKETPPPVAQAQPARATTVQTPAPVAAQNPTTPTPSPAATQVATPAAAAPAVAAAAPVVAQPQTLPQVAPAPATPPAEAAPGKRLVRRQGLVRATKSIQAPTWYELIHPQTKVTINYLHEEKLGIKLKEFRGKMVVVSGEEAIDPRWPNTPIMELETLEMAP